MSIALGQQATLSALQMTMLCDAAIEKYLDRLEKYKERQFEGIVLCEEPQTMESAKDAVVEWFEENMPEACAEEKQEAV